jgi:hypothetical protein
MRLTGCQREPDWQAVGIDYRIYLAGQPARDRPMDRLRFRMMQAPC